MNLVKHSYREEDCIFLLKDISDKVVEVTIEEKESLINQGVSYSEMLSKENHVDEKIKNLFEELVNDSARDIAKYVGSVAEKIYNLKGKDTVIVSLARAGSPFGILIKRYIKFRYKIDVPHYSVSIIRGKGIDFNALNYIVANNPNGKIQFVDGWTGKGSITKELHKTIKIFNDKYGMNIDSNLAVIADPAKLSKISGTQKDINLPNCCLNSTVSGLISRTVHNKDIIGETDFHGAKYLDYLEEEDYSQFFIDSIEWQFTLEDKDISESKIVMEYAPGVIEEIRSKYDVTDIHKIKLSIGEASRALLRRKTKLVLVKNFENKDVAHIIHMAKEKNIEVKEFKNSDYECVAIIE